VIVEWGLDALPRVLGGRRAFLLATSRWDAPVDVLRPWVLGRWSDLPTELAIDPGDAEVVLALGGGSTIDTAKRVSAESGLPLVSVPTTYSGAEWTRFFGIRDARRRMQGGGGGSHNEAIVYDVDLTIDLPAPVTGGTALNALAHSCEALYALGRDPAADPIALAGAEAISESLPRVLADLRDREAREALLRGAAAAGEALGRSGLALGHAMAQTIGGRYGLPHGALNAICLPAALRFNAEFVPPSLLEGNAAARAGALARLAGFDGLGALGVPPGDFADLAEAIVERPGARANPRPVTPGDALALLREIV
jgi:alcohol dehydrogenase class IV